MRHGGPASWAREVSARAILPCSSRAGSGRLARGGGEVRGEVARGQAARAGERREGQRGQPRAGRAGEDRGEAAHHPVGPERGVGEAAQRGQLGGERRQQRVGAAPGLGHRERGEDERARALGVPAPRDREQGLVLGGRGGRGDHQVEGHDAGAAAQEEVGEVGHVAARERLALAERQEGVVVDQHQHDLGGGHAVAQEEERVDRARLPAREHAGARERGHRHRDEQADQHRAQHPRAGCGSPSGQGQRPTPRRRAESLVITWSRLPIIDQRRDRRQARPPQIGGSRRRVRDNGPCPAR